MVRPGHFRETVWASLGAKAGLPYRKYHATRHTYATWLLETGADLRWVSARMGHASLKQTADTYGHLIMDRHQAAAGALDGLIGAPTPRKQNGPPSARLSAASAQPMGRDAS